jgi:two-component system cell cycle response regulator
LSEILIAEDDRVCRMVLEKNLRDWGYEVRSTVNGKTAWHEIRKGNIQIAIVDWIMPKIDGAELCRKIREECESGYIYVIMLTVKSQKEDIRAGLAAGADDYITKPFDSEELRARLETGKRIISLQNELLESKKILERLATHDALTGLLNRHEILETLLAECSRADREHKPLGTIMLDIDLFKEINDTYGHQGGDEVLIEVGLRIKKVIRRYDKVGRYGGDEFLVICPNCSLNNAERVAQRLRRAIHSERFRTESGPVFASVSLGCASTESLDRASSEYLIRTSDKAMYHSKNKGRDCVTVL